MLYDSSLLGLFRHVMNNYWDACPVCYGYIGFIHLLLYMLKPFFYTVGFDALATFFCVDVFLWHCFYRATYCGLRISNPAHLHFQTSLCYFRR